MSSSDDRINEQVRVLQSEAARKREQEEAARKERIAHEKESRKQQVIENDLIEDLIKRFAVWAKEHRIPRDAPTIGFRGGWKIGDYFIPGEPESWTNHGDRGYYAINGRGDLYRCSTGRKGTTLKRDKSGYSDVGLTLIENGIAKIVARSGKPW